MSARAPDATVVVPARNRPAAVARTLAALATCTAPIEVVVIDNGSEDDTVAAARAALPSARIVELHENRGAASRNVGLALARARHVVMLDDDSHPAPGTLERAIALLDARPELGCAAFRVQVGDERASSPELGGRHDVFIGCGAAFRTDVLRRAGGYPDAYGYYVEEYEVSWRILELGYEVRSFRDLVVYHRKDPAGRSNERVLRQLVRNNLLLHARTMPALDAVAESRRALARYARLARAWGVLGAFARGVATGLVAAVRARIGRGAARPVAGHALERARVTGPLATRLVEAAALHRATRLLLLGAGKELPAFVGAAERAGLRVEGLVHDHPSPTPCGDLRVFASVSDAVAQLGEGALLGVVAYASPGATERALDWWSRQCRTFPMFAPFEFDETSSTRAFGRPRAPRAQASEVP